MRKLIFLCLFLSQPVFADSFVYEKITDNDVKIQATKTEEVVVSMESLKNQLQRLESEKAKAQVQINKTLQRYDELIAQVNQHIAEAKNVGVKESVLGVGNVEQSN